MRNTSLLILVFMFLSSFTFAQEEEKNIAEDDFKNKSTDEIAKDLANPNTPLTSLRFKTQFRGFTGSLPNADNQNSTLILLHPTLPFPLKNGKKIWVRPGIPYLTKQTYYNENGFEIENGLGDIVIDFQYGGTTKKGLLWSFGTTTTFPTATKNVLGINQWAVGPGLQLAFLSKKAVAGGFINYQFGLTKPEEAISIISFQMFAIFLPTGGWNLGTAPIISYNDNNNTWAVPINFAFGKTVKIGNRPWKISIETNYYIKQNLPYEPKWMVGINIAPVVKNYLANLF